MQQLQILTYQIGKTYAKPHFFILNKGLNSGKPLKTSCPTCFVLISNDETEMDLNYWLVYGLWRAKSFHPYPQRFGYLFRYNKRFKSSGNKS